MKEVHEISFSALSCKCLSTVNKHGQEDNSGLSQAHASSHLLHTLPGEPTADYGLGQTFPTQHKHTHL